MKSVSHGILAQTPHASALAQGAHVDKLFTGLTQLGNHWQLVQSPFQQNIIS